MYYTDFNININVNKIKLIFLNKLVQMDETAESTHFVDRYCSFSLLNSLLWKLTFKDSNGVKVIREQQMTKQHSGLVQSHGHDYTNPDMKQEYVNKCNEPERFNIYSKCIANNVLF